MLRWGAETSTRCVAGEEEERKRHQMLERVRRRCEGNQRRDDDDGLMIRSKRWRCENNKWGHFVFRATGEILME